MSGAKRRRGTLLLRSTTAILASILVVACSPTMDANLEGANGSFNAAPEALNETTTEESAAQTVALAPAAQAAAAADKPAPSQQVAALTPPNAPDQPEAVLETSKPKTAEAGAQADKKPEAAAETLADAKKTETADAKPAADTAQTAEAAPAAGEAPQQKTFLASFFGAGKPAKPKAPSPIADESETAKPKAAEAAKPAAKPAKVAEAPMPALSFENIAPVGEKSQRVAAKRNQPPEIQSVRASAFADDGEGTGLPGVRKSALFDIKRKSGVDEDISDVDIHEDVDTGPIQLASAGGMARLAPNGLLKQRESVDVGCLKPSLVRVLKTIERRFGKKVVITSGYRSPNYNRKVRGAKNSQHMYCAAADIQVPGVSRWELANFARSMPGRGGVGTYCHTASVHVDVGPERDWNWRCRGRRS